MLLTRQYGGPNAIIRALAPTAWFQNGVGVTVTGSGVSLWADQVDTANALVLPGVSGNFGSSPNAVPLQVTGDLELVCKIESSAYATINQQILGRDNGAAAYDLQLSRGATTAKTLSLIVWQSTLAQIATSSAALSTSDGVAVWVKVTLAVATGKVNFYTSSDGSVWTILGVEQTITAASTDAGNSALGIGASSAGTTNFFLGKIHRVIIKSGIGGTAVFDADFTAQTRGATSFTESSSNAATVTVNQSGDLPAHIGSPHDYLQGTDANRPTYSGGVLTFNGTSQYLKTNAFTLNQPTWRVTVLKQVAWTINKYLYDGVNGGAQAYQDAASPKISLFAGTTLIGTTDLAVGTIGILTAVFNGASSSIQINNSAAITGAAGAGNPGGLTLGATRVPTGNSNIAVLEEVVFNYAPTAAQITQVVNALGAKLGIAV